MLDQLRRRPVARYDDVLADRGDLEQLGGEGEWQADAAMRGRIAGNHAGMQRRAGPGDPVHPGHRRAAIDVGMVESLLLEDAEDARLGGVSRHAGRDGRARDQRRAAIDVELLLLSETTSTMGSEVSMSAMPSSGFASSGFRFLASAGAVAMATASAPTPSQVRNVVEAPLATCVALPLVAYAGYAKHTLPVMVRPKVSLPPVSPSDSTNQSKRGTLI